MKSKLLSMFAAVALSLGLASCADDDVANNGTHGGSQPSGKLTTFTAQAPGGTRTSLNYDNGKYFWEDGDKIWVLDDTHTWQTSSNSVSGSGLTKFKFQVSGTFGGSTTYPVIYHSNSTNGDQVKIAAAQTQATPNTTTHFGDAGDHGIATASLTDAVTNEYAFRLDHKAAYLVFEPYTSNAVLKNCYLTKIEVYSDNDIAGTFTINPTTGQLSGTGSNKITLTTQGAPGSATEHGFPLTSATNAATGRANCGAYMVIKPGTHKLRVRYFVESPTEQVEYQGSTLPLKGCITRYYSGTYNANGYYDLSANLTVVDYSSPSPSPVVAGTKAKPIPYYMWDAAQPYWYQHEWNKPGYTATIDQPTTNNQNGSAYPQNNADSRWHSETYNGSGVETSASQTPLFTSLPNANEMSWYVIKGEPRWDGDELWMAMGKFYKGSMWFKKMGKIIADNPTAIADAKAAMGVPTATDAEAVKARGITGSGTYADFRTTYSSAQIYSTPSISSNPFPTADAGNYFQLPTLGVYLLGTLNNAGNYGYYWSSSALPGNSYYAYNLYFQSGFVNVGTYFRYFGFSVVPFE